MREILFKAKRKDNEEWVEGFLFDDGMAEVERYFIGRLVIVPYKGNCDDDWDIEATDFYEINPDTICQFTGLCDKNGNRIWENDIVSFPQYEYTEFGVCFESCIGKMYWDKNTASFDILYDREPAFYSLLNNENLQVIGNIFDNADLLEEK